MNNIIGSTSPVPGLTQDDSFVNYCSAKKLPTGCNVTSPCVCPHLIQLKTNHVYEFVFIDDDGIKSNMYIGNESQGR